MGRSSAKKRGPARAVKKPVRAPTGPDEQASADEQVGATQNAAPGRSAGTQRGEDTTPTLSRKARLMPFGLAIVGGTCQFLGFAGYDLWPFAFFPFVFFLTALELLHAQGARTRRRLLVGWTHGFVTYTGGYYWLVEMLENFSGYHGAPNWFFASVFFAFLAGQHAVFAWLYGRARTRGFAPALILIAGIAALEQFYPALFPSYLANGFHQIPIAIQLADLGGPVLVSVVILLVNAAVFEVGRAIVQKRPVPWKLPAGALAAVLLTLGYGAYRVSAVDAAAEAADKLNVGVIQVNMGIFSKRDDPWEGHRRHLAQTRALTADEDIDLVVWPESAFTFFLPDGTSNVQSIVTRGIDTPVLFGGLARREIDGTEKHYNTAYLADGRGEILGTYDKTYLLMFGEYLPFGETFPWIYDLSPNSGRFTPGSHVKPLTFGDTRISTLICYEDVLPGFTRAAVREGDPHLLVNITNDAWFGDTLEPWIHLALAKFRAVEHHRALVRSTNSGVSAVVDPVGRVVTHGGVFTRETLRAEVPLLDHGTVYGVAGDWPGWAGLGGILWMAFLTRPDRKRDPAVA